jgi:hypothetical protein
VNWFKLLKYIHLSLKFDYSNTMKSIHTTLITLILSTLITACGGGGTSNLPGTAQTVPITPGVVPSDPAPSDPMPSTPVPSNPAPSEPAPSVSSESVDLSWDIPNTKLDGSPISLSEIGGYRIYEGTNSSDVSLLIDISNDTTTYTITGLSVGTHYFYVTTYDSEGHESPFSNVVQKTLL